MTDKLSIDKFQGRDQSENWQRNSYGQRQNQTQNQIQNQPQNNQGFKKPANLYIG